MAVFSKASAAKLKTCHINLQVILLEAIKEIDFVVLCGERTIAEQQKLYAQGRTTAGNIVTHIDGITKKSNHNYTPSLAVDIAPYPIDWNNLDRFRDLAKVIKRIAMENSIELRWGGDFSKLKDFPHFELA
jgi:hypothetical protein